MIYELQFFFLFFFFCVCVFMSFPIFNSPENRHMKPQKKNAECRTNFVWKPFNFSSSKMSFLQRQIVKVQFSVKFIKKVSLNINSFLSLSLFCFSFKKNWNLNLNIWSSVYKMKNKPWRLHTMLKSLHCMWDEKGKKKKNLKGKLNSINRSIQQQKRSR